MMSQNTRGREGGREGGGRDGGREEGRVTSVTFND